MRFTIHHHPPHNPGYTAPPTGGDVLDLGILDTEENTIPKPSAVWRLPTHVRVSVQLVPQWAAPTAELEYVEEGVSKGIISAHGPDAYKSESRSLVAAGVASAINFQYRGQAQLIYADGEKETVYGEIWNGAMVQLATGNVLFSKPFATLPAGRYTCMAVRAGGQWRVTPRGAINHWPRYALGGYYTPQADITQMEQLYVTVDQGAGRTTAHAERSSAYQQKYGAYPPAPIAVAGSTIVFVHTADPMQQLSVGETITQGRIPLILQVGDTPHRFTSLSYETVAPSCLEVVFTCGG